MKYSLLFVILAALNLQIHANPIKKVKIVIDPGHGGAKQDPMEIYGDKFDTITGRYLEYYKEGAADKKNNRTEMEIVLEVAKEVKDILDLTKTKKGFKKFQSYIKLFSDTEAPWIKIESVMTRTDNYRLRKYRDKEDKNQLYRLYDFPDFETGKMRLGRISMMNKEKPQLVVSIHINSMQANGGGGMGVVLAPSYQTFELLKRISEKQASSEEFTKSPWGNWMIFQNNWSRLENAMADAWIYFNGYWPNKAGNETDIERFEGYRFNMITWKYKDKDGWEKTISNSKEGPYAIDHNKFRATGKFWDRERGKPELMKREGGPEGFGGDNHYAGAELLRFMQYGLRLQVNEEKDTFKEPSGIVRPFVSTYSVPTFINAISAYLELGEIGSDRDMFFLTTKKKKTAICLAVGIYSLFNGLELRPINSTAYIPKGKRIEFEKYVGKTGESYFEEAISEKEEKNEQ